MGALSGAKARRFHHPHVPGSRNQIVCQKWEKHTENFRWKHEGKCRDLFSSLLKAKRQLFLHHTQTPLAMLIKDSGCFSPAFLAFDLKWPPQWAIQGSVFPRKSLLWRPTLWFLATRAKKGGCKWVPSSFSSSPQKGARNERVLLLDRWTNTVRRNKQSSGSFNAYTHYKEETHSDTHTKVVTHTVTPAARQIEYRLRSQSKRGGTHTHKHTNKHTLFHTVYYERTNNSKGEVLP